MNQMALLKQEHDEVERMLEHHPALFDKLREYQKECIRQVRACIRDSRAKGNKGANILLCAPTGSGKTLIASYIIYETMKNLRRACFVVDRINLVDQTSEAFDDIGIPHGVHQADHERRRPWERVQVCSAQTLVRRQWPETDVIVVDECFTPDVEVLTERGFVRFDELPRDLRCAQYDLNTGRVSFAMPTAYIDKEHHGEMVTLKSDRTCDLTMTPSHQLVVHTASGVIKKVEASKLSLSCRNKMPAAGFASAPRSELTPMDRLAIAYQADGSLHHEPASGGATLSFTFVKKRKVLRLLQIVEDCGLRYTEVKAAEGRRRFLIYGAPFLPKCIGNYFSLPDIDDHKARAIIEEMVEWDGHKHSDTITYFSSTVEQNVDFYQSVAILAGYRTNKIVQHDDRSEAFSDVYRLFIQRKERFVGGQAISRTISHYDGRVYCVRVPDGNIIVRRNGKALVVGNCHTINEVTKKRIEKRDVITLGLTATPFTKGLGLLYDYLVNVTTTNDLIELGFLSNYRIFAASEPDMTGVKVRAGEWDEKEASKRAMQVVGDCVAEYLKHANGKKFICSAVDVDHVQALHKQFMDAGVMCATYTYRDPDALRRDIVTEFRKPDSYLRGLITVTAATKGFDVPDIECVIMARPLRKSLAEVIQFFGRGLRISPDTGKTECLVLDHSGNLTRFWHQWTEFFATGATELDDGKKKDKKESKPAEEKTPMKCPVCHHLHDPAPFCPHCGHEYPRRINGVQHVAGSLREILSTGNINKITTALWPQIVGYAKTRSNDMFRQEKIALALFKQITGNWPKNASFSNTVGVDPTPEVLGKIMQKEIAFQQRMKEQRRLEKALAAGK